MRKQQIITNLQEYIEALWGAFDRKFNNEKKSTEVKEGVQKVIVRRSKTKVKKAPKKKPSKGKK